MRNFPHSVPDAAERRRRRRAFLSSVTPDEARRIDARELDSRLALAAAHRRSLGIRCDICDGTDHDTDDCPHDEDAAR